MRTAHSRPLLPSEQCKQPRGFSSFAGLPRTCPTPTAPMQRFVIRTDTLRKLARLPTTIKRSTPQPILTCCNALPHDSSCTLKCSQPNMCLLQHEASMFICAAYSRRNSGLLMAFVFTIRTLSNLHSFLLVKTCHPRLLQARLFGVLLKEFLAKAWCLLRDPYRPGETDLFQAVALAVSQPAGKRVRHATYFNQLAPHTSFTEKIRKERAIRRHDTSSTLT